MKRLKPMLPRLRQERDDPKIDDGKRLRFNTFPAIPLFIAAAVVATITYPDFAAAQEEPARRRASDSATPDAVAPATSQFSSDADRERAASLVREALMNEVYGDRTSRNKLLREAIELDPANEEARWHSGYVRLADKWLDREAMREQYQDDQRIGSYIEQREAAEDTVAGQLQLANWCRRRGLNDQERAHLSRVIQIDPNNEVARARLGFQRDENGKWVAAEERLAAQLRQRTNAELLSTWRGAISGIREGLSSNRRERKQRAEQELLSIRDPDAIPAIEVILSSNPEHVYLAIQTISRMRGLEAANSLARHAVFANQADARQLAAIELKSRDKFEYVPDLLGEMVTPIRSIEQLIPGQGRRLVHRTTWIREDQDAQFVAVNDEAYRRIPMGDGSGTRERVMNNVNQRSMRRNQGMMLANLQTEELNRRICDALSTATGENLPAQPQAWWEWWNQDNDILIEGTKQQIVAYDYNETVVSESPFTMPAPQPTTTQTPVQSNPPRTGECLPRGTLVWTAEGAMAIESIQVGDMVLAQNIESGELTYAPVLRTTRRAPGPLVRIECYDETIRASQGHPFWVSGSGWIKACDLESGMELHTTDGTLRISDVSQTAAEETFNLVVDRHATYFVGKHRILSHDHTLPTATEQIVPGLTE